MTLLHRHSTARGTPPAPLPEMVFHGLAPDENAQMQGVVLGTGDLVAARTSSIYTPDMDGVDREFIDVQPGISGARTDLDPAQYFSLVTNTAATPDPFSVIIGNRAGQGTARYKYIEPGGDVFYTPKTTAYTNRSVPVGTDLYCYNGNFAGLSWLYCNNQKAIGSFSEWIVHDCERLYLGGNSFSGPMDSLDNLPSLDLLSFSGNTEPVVVPSSAPCPLLTTYSGYSGAVTGVASDFAWPAGGGSLSVFQLHVCEITSSDDINRILIAADAEIADGSGHTISLQGGTNAEPTGAGITAKDSLITKGASVTTN